VWAPKCAGDPKIFAHGCVVVIQIAMHGCAHRGDKGAHGMCACLLHNCTWVRGCAVDRHTMMHA
jgi:hypothetical protein